MSAEENKKSAEKIFKRIKNELADARKYNKEKGVSLQDGMLTMSRKEQMVSLYVEPNTKWSNNRWYNESYNIGIGGYKSEDIVKEIKYRSDVESIFRELGKMLQEQKKVKGWNGLVYTTEKSYLGGNVWDSYSTTIISKICLADAVCPEYKSLINYINKYGRIEGYTNYKPTFSTYRFFCSAMGGKRGRLWDEYGERYFLDNRPKRCEKLLKELREHKGTKDIMLCKEGEEDYINEIDRKYSEYHEVECEGEKRHYIKITIKTPSGKVKYETKIY